MIHCLLSFIVWTLLMYWMHRFAHVIPGLKDLHFAHHRYISSNPPPQWHWSNLFIFQDNWTSTAEVLVFEFVPTAIFCWFTGDWWILIFYYCWSAAIQEHIEHNPKFNIYPWLTSGQWHLLHHARGTGNYGLFTPVWDLLFGTYKEIPRV